MAQLTQKVSEPPDKECDDESQEEIDALEREIQKKRKRAVRFAVNP